METSHLAVPGAAERWEVNSNTSAASSDTHLPPNFFDPPHISDSTQRLDLANRQLRRKSEQAVLIEQSYRQPGNFSVNSLVDLPVVGPAFGTPFMYASSSIYTLGNGLYRSPYPSPPPIDDTSFGQHSHPFGQYYPAVISPPTGVGQLDARNHNEDPVPVETSLRGASSSTTNSINPAASFNLLAPPRPQFATLHNLSAETFSLGSQDLCRNTSSASSEHERMQRSILRGPTREPSPVSTVRTAPEMVPATSLEQPAARLVLRVPSPLSMVASQGDLSEVAIEAPSKRRLSRRAKTDLSQRAVHTRGRGLSIYTNDDALSYVDSHATRFTKYSLEVENESDCCCLPGTNLLKRFGRKIKRLGRSRTESNTDENTFRERHRSMMTLGNVDEEMHNREVNPPQVAKLAQQNEAIRTERKKSNALPMMMNPNIIS